MSHRADAFATTPFLTDALADLYGRIRKARKLSRERIAAWRTELSVLRTAREWVDEQNAAAHVTALEGELADLRSSLDRGAISRAPEPPSLEALQ